MRAKRFSTWAIGLAGILTLLGWSAARAVTARRLPKDPVCQKLATLVTALPPQESAIFETAALLSPAQMPEMTAWLYDLMRETVGFLQQARGEARLESTGAKDKVAKLDEALHVVSDILLPAFNENQAQLLGEIAAYQASQPGTTTSGGGGAAAAGAGGGSPTGVGAPSDAIARIQMQFFLLVHRTLLCLQVARESGVGGNRNEKAVLKTGAGNGAVEPTNDPTRPTSAGGGTAAGAGGSPGGMDGRPPEASPFI